MNQQQNLDLRNNPILKNEIWILADDRPGTFLQSIGLANELGVEYKIIKLSYNFLSSLPNFLLPSSILQLKKESQENIKKLQYLPSIIISAGRKSAPIALYFKNKSQNKSKIIQIMNPDLNFKKFDFVILPKHDKASNSRFPNLISTIGSLTKTNEETIKTEKNKFAAEFGNISKIKIALLIGGSSNKTKFTIDSAKKLAKLASNIAKNMNAILLVLNSRRTEDEISETIKSNLDCDFKFFDFKETADKNPYLAVIGYSDFGIISGDSVSMISEYASLGKPLYIFDEKNISTTKHRKFHKALFDGNHAKNLTEEVKILENFSPTKLQETKRVADLIRNRKS